MTYLLIAAAGLAVGLIAGYIIGTSATLLTIQAFIESETDYAERDRHIES